MTGLDKNAISKFIPGQIAGLALWIQADKTKCTFQPVEEYVKTVPPTIADNILKQYGNTASQKVLVAVNSLVISQPNSLVRLEVDTTGRTKFPTFVSEPEKLDVISLQDMVDPANPSQRAEKLCTKSDLPLSSANMSVYSISNNINITFNDNLQMLLVSVADIKAPVTDFSEIIVFSRKLSGAEVELMEGYLAYKRNDQYLLKLGHKYLPNIQMIPFLTDMASKIADTELSITTDMENFDVAVEKYRERLPTAEILQQAPPLKQKATAALDQLSTIRQNMVKGGLLARKQKTENMNATFDSINKLSLYSEPFTVDIFIKKLTDYDGVKAELEAYMKSLEDVDKDVAAAIDQNKTSDQLKKRSEAISVEALNEKNDVVEMKQFYIDRRQAIAVLNSLGKSKYDAMYTSFLAKIKSDGDNFNYYNSTIKTKWDSLMGNYGELDDIIISGEWLTYDTTLKTDNTVIKRNDQVFNTKYTDPHLNRIQTLYEQIRNQIVEGDLKFIRNEVDAIMTTYNTLAKRVNNKQVSPLSKKMFGCFLKKKLKQLISYEAEFMKLYTVINDAVNELLRVLNLNKKYSSSKVKVEKEYPIPILYSFKDAAQQLRNVRLLNKHDHSLTMIEYIETNTDGTIKYVDADNTMEVELVFPSIEPIIRNKGDDFFIKKLPYCDENGIQLFQKYMILAPYSKEETMLDAISKSQVLPKFFHVVDAQFEIPRDAENGIYEMSASSPQMPILLPKYAMSDGTFFICVNVGEVPIHVQIPGFTEDLYDLIGPDEVCMYIYTGVADSTTTFYGRVQWVENRIAYDTIYDVPRSSFCRKMTDMSKYIYMSGVATPNVPLFDRDGFLVEVVPDKDSYIYDIDDIHRACPYKVTIGDDMKISDLKINEDWGEKMIPAPQPTSLHVVEEASTGLTVFCNNKGIPAINEFGYTKYVRAPLLQINDKIVTRSSNENPIEITLNPNVQLVQYGLMQKTAIFRKVYRSNFVKPFGGTTTLNTANTFIFVNSLGYPLVAPTNTYIQVENFMFDPPYYVKYTENFIAEYSYIPEESSFFVASKNVLDAKPFTQVSQRTPEEREIAETSRIIRTVSYRYTCGGAYIQYTITKLQTELTTCNLLKGQFAGIADTIELLNNCIKDIGAYQADYMSYKVTIIAIKTREMIADQSNDERMAMTTFDLKMKDTLNKVYKSYTTGLKPVVFFLCIVKKIDKIRASVKDLSDVKGIAIENSIKNIQTVIQNQAASTASQPNTDLKELLNTCTLKKVEFKGIVKTLDSALTNIPSDLDVLEKWVNDQNALIDHATDLYKEIIDIDNLHTVNVFTQQILNGISNTTKQLQENTDKVNTLIEYKKKIAKWLEVYPDSAALIEYRNQLPIPITTTSLKGYTIQFLPFEEALNPAISRDWYSLPDTMILSKATRTRISIGMIEPIRGFITKYADYYKKYNVNANAPDPSSYQRTDEAGLKQIVDDSNKVTNNLIAEAMEAEGELAPIFNEYKSIRSDLKGEIQKVLEALAKDIQAKWLDCTGKRTAIQTKLKLMEPYFDSTQAGDANKIIVKMDDLFTSDKLAAIDDIQRSTKVPDYYGNMNYIKMIETHTNWGDVQAVLIFIQDQIQGLQSSMDTIQTGVVQSLAQTIQTGRDKIQTTYTKVKSGMADGSKLKDLTGTMDPLISSMEAVTATDLPSSIGLIQNIKNIQAQLDGY